MIAESTENIRERFTLLTVTQDNLEQAKQLKPLFSNSLMGLTTMLFDNQKSEDLQVLGKISVPSLADIFVGVMTKEICS